MLLFGLILPVIIIKKKRMMMLQADGAALHPCTARPVNGLQYAFSSINNAANPKACGVLIS
jgi:hypothetical protein